MSFQNSSRRKELDLAFYGKNEVEDLIGTPDYFWTKGFIILSSVIRLEEYENVEVFVKHIDLKHLLVEENRKTVLIDDCRYSYRDFTSKKYELADLSYPIMITDTVNQPEKYGVMDGHTRTNKAKNRGHTTIEAYHIDYFELEKHCYFWDPISGKNISIYEQRQILGK